MRVLVSVSNDVAQTIAVLVEVATRAFHELPNPPSICLPRLEA